MHEVLVAELVAMRQGSACINQEEKFGGGRKPFRQKEGTGAC